MTWTKLLPVINQRLLARLAEMGTVFLQAGQHRLIAFVQMRTAESRSVARAGIAPLLLRRRCGRDQNQRNENKESGHLSSLQ
jgi:hypothetical protein